MKGFCMKKHLVIAFFVCSSLFGMEQPEQQENDPLSPASMEVSRALSEFKRFNDLPVLLRAKIIAHLCDCVPGDPNEDYSFWQMFPRQVLPFLKTCKRYYLNETAFTGELLEMINKKRWDNIFAVGINVPTPACKLVLSRMLQTQPAYKKLFDATSCVWLLKHRYMRSDIENNHICFKQSTSNN